MSGEVAVVIPGMGEGMSNSRDIILYCRRGNITSTYLTSIHSTLLFTMSSFLLRARWVVTIRFLIMCLLLLDPGSNSQEC